MSRPLVFSKMLVTKVTPQHEQRIQSIITMSNGAHHSESDVVRAAIDAYYNQVLMTNTLQSAFDDAAQYYRGGVQ